MFDRLFDVLWYSKSKDKSRHTATALKNNEYGLTLTDSFRVHQRRGGWWQCLNLLETEMIVSLEAVSDLHWKNVVRNEN